MPTEEQINEILAPWGTSINERPVPNDDYAYEAKDRCSALNAAMQWQKDHGHTDVGMDASRDDFICHQADIIFMLTHALRFANSKLNITKGE
jgi:hypothetical protein